MPEARDRKRKFKQSRESMKIPFARYSGMECSLEK